MSAGLRFSPAAMTARPASVGVNSAMGVLLSNEMELPVVSWLVSGVVGATASKSPETAPRPGSVGTMSATICGVSTYRFSCGTADISIAGDKSMPSAVKLSPVKPRSPPAGRSSPKEFEATSNPSRPNPPAPPTEEVKSPSNELPESAKREPPPPKSKSRG